MYYYVVKNNKQKINKIFVTSSIYKLGNKCWNFNGIKC